jgi:hypothetical protein
MKVKDGNIFQTVIPLFVYKTDINKYNDIRFTNQGCVGNDIQLLINTDLGKIRVKIKNNEYEYINMGITK